jgi:transcriptional regulator with XRE-family HTH domain
MYQNDSKVTSFSSITLIVLRELRLERNIHQAQVAEICNKTPSAWTKIETGKNPLTMDIFFKVCIALNVSASSVLATAERYAALLTQNGWGIMSGELPFSEDMLLQEAQEYYGSAGYRARIPVSSWNTFISVLNGPIYNHDGTITMIDVIYFILNAEFRANQVGVKAL